MVFMSLIANCSNFMHSGGMIFQVIQWNPGSMQKPTLPQDHTQ